MGNQMSELPDKGVKLTPINELQILKDGYND